MALDASTLQSAIESEMEAEGFDLDKGKASVLAAAVAKAVVDHITTDAEVVVPSGSSAGTYPVT